MHASTVSREVKRNTWLPSNESESYRPYRPKRLRTGPWTGRYYIAGQVQRKADRRRAKARRPYRLASERLWSWTAERLRRGARGRGVAGSRIPLRTSIRERPHGPSDRSRFGEWEADGVIGAGCNLHTEVERRTRFLMARIVPDKTARESVAAQIAMFSALPAGARTGVTHDNGTEFARHGRLRERLGVATYFADPYSSYQRGSNKNRNGAIRRYLPKRSRIEPSMAADAQAIVDEINNRPMRVLGYRTPAEAFTDELLELTNEQGRCTSK